MQLYNSLSHKKEEFKEIIKYYFGEFFYENIYIYHTDIEK